MTILRKAFPLLKWHPEAYASIQKCLFGEQCTHYHAGAFPVFSVAYPALGHFYDPKLMNSRSFVAPRKPPVQRGLRTEGPQLASYVCLCVRACPRKHDVAKQFHWDIRGNQATKRYTRAGPGLSGTARDTFASSSRVNVVPSHHLRGFCSECMEGGGR